MKALDGVTVIDFTQTYSGPFCTMQLADFGAKVIKIERKGVGDAARFWPPFHDGHSGYFAAVNRNKLSMELDLTSMVGIEIAERLLKSADIVVECFKPGTMEKLGLGYEAVIKYNPEIIYASLSGFGQSGPLKTQPAYDNVIQAMSGLADMTGFPELPPVKAGPAVSDSLAGLNMGLAIVMAYYHKLNTGQGQRIDVAMLDSLFGILESPIMFDSLLDCTVSRCGNNDAATLVPYDAYPCKDGYFAVGLAGESGWDKFTAVMGRPELEEDTRFSSNALRCMNFKVLDPILQSFFIDKTREELQQAFTAVGIPNAPVLSVPEIMTHQQLKDRNMLIEIKDRGVGDYIAMGNPMNMDQSPPTYGKGAPLLGEDTEDILKQYGFAADQIIAFRKAGVI
jgi:CoA:oxalate CoA-transferase